MMNKTTQENKEVKIYTIKLLLLPNEFRMLKHLMKKPIGTEIVLIYPHKGSEEALLTQRLFYILRTVIEVKKWPNISKDAEEDTIILVKKNKFIVEPIKKIKKLDLILAKITLIIST